jgi:molybdopterin/thiamine biosynthesis adenylyltransferase
MTAISADGSLLLNLDPRRRIELEDVDGAVLGLLSRLAEGTRTVEELARAQSSNDQPVTAGELEVILKQFDEWGWLENADARTVLSDHERERFHSNLAFFDAFTTLALDREPIQRRLTQAHVAVLGAGGLGSCVLQSLAGFGIGRLTVVDFDAIELRNFARQFTYFPDQVGESKVDRVADWLRAFHPDAHVVPLRRRIERPEDVSELLPGVDLLVSAIDTPDEIDLWVNQACVAAGVPFIRPGLAYIQGVYWSVDPGISACRFCLELYRQGLATGVDAAVARGEQAMRAQRVNRGIGPVAQVLGGLTALEAVRYLTNITAPVSAGAYRLIDFGGTAEADCDPWPADPSCPVCATAPARRPGPA